MSRNFAQMKADNRLYYEKYTNVMLIKILIQSDQEDRRVISEEQGQLLAVQHGIDFIECSALNGENVREAFLRMARRVKAKHETKSKTSTPKNQSNVTILSDPGHAVNSKFGNCCWSTV